MLLAVLGLTLEADVRAETTILSSMNVVKSDGVVRAEARFGCSLKLVSYEPRGMTQQLNIHLVPIGRCSDLNAQSSVMEMNYFGKYAFVSAYV